MNLLAIIQHYIDDREIVEEMENFFDTSTLREFYFSLIRDYNLESELVERAKEIIEDLDLEEIVDFIEENE